MRKHELESWVLCIVDRVTAKQPIEDARVELKAEWIDARKAARRLAGHANAAQGEPILWVIGLDENKGVVGATKKELSDWYAQIEKECDGLAPHLDTDINVPVDGKTVVALLFSTDRAPYVVLNPDRGTEASIKIHREVPWRTATELRSAKRADLIRLLSPLQKMPAIEVVSGSFSISKTGALEDLPHLTIEPRLEMDVYVVPQDAAPLVIPNHHCSGTFRIFDSQDWCDFERVYLEHSTFGARRDARFSSNLAVSHQDAIMSGACMVRVIALPAEDLNRSDYAAEGMARLELGPVGFERPLVIEIPMSHEEDATSPFDVWTWAGTQVQSGA